jgi:predicted nucleotidyltransferase
MITHHLLNYIFASRFATAILRELNLRKKGITGREAARLIGITHRSVLQVLSHLESLKLVKKEGVGRAYYFTLNRKHYLYKTIIIPMFEAEKQLAPTLFKDIAKALGMFSESIILFGSVARGEETIESDFDICLVFKSNQARIEKEISNLRIMIYDKYGITFAPYLIPVKDFNNYLINKRPPVVNIAKEGKVIYGRSLKDLING